MRVYYNVFQVVRLGGSWERLDKKLSIVGESREDVMKVGEIKYLQAVLLLLKLRLDGVHQRCKVRLGYDTVAVSFVE